MIKKIDEERLQLYGLVKKATEKLMNQISKLEVEKYFKHKSAKFKRKRNNMDQIMDIVKPNKLTFQRKELRSSDNKANL